MDLTRFNGMQVSDEVSAAQAFDTNYSGSARCKNPDCRSANLVTDWEAGDLVCAECGWVRHARIEDPGKEWRNIESDEGRERASGPASRIAQLYESDAQDVMVARGSGHNKAEHGSLQDRLAKGSGGLSAHDKMLEDVYRDVKNLSSKLPGQVPDKTQFDTVQLYKIMWSENKEKLRRTPGLVAACLWTVCFSEQLPLVDADFHRALKGVGVADPLKDFKKAKDSLRKVYSASAAMRELCNTIAQRAGKASRFAKVCVRWTSELLRAVQPEGKPYTDTFVFAVATWTSEVGAYISSAKQEFQDANRVKPELVYAAAIHWVLHRAGASEEEQQVTATKVSDKAALGKSGAREIEKFLGKYASKQKAVLDAAAKKLRPDQRQELGLEAK